MNDTDTMMLKPGSYSHGTMRDEDMAEMFNAIATLTKCETCDIETNRLGRELDELDRFPENINLREAVSWSINGLFDHVADDHTPEGMTFGAHAGDGTDYGVWPADLY